MSVDRGERKRQLWIENAIWTKNVFSVLFELQGHDFIPFTVC
jgi:hypothetical protein